MRVRAARELRNEGVNLGTREAAVTNGVVILHALRQVEVPRCLVEVVLAVAVVLSLFSDC